jgi:hypothetical protein
MAFKDMPTCLHTRQPLLHHSLVWCQLAGQNTQRHEDIVHLIANAINANTNNHVAVANPNLAFPNTQAGLTASAPQELRPADIIVDNTDLIDVTVVDPRTRHAIDGKYYEKPDKVFHDAIRFKYEKYQNVVQRDNRKLLVFAFSHFGKPHYFVLKTLRHLFKTTDPEHRLDLYKLRVNMSLVFIKRAAGAIENHLRPPRLNVQTELQAQQMQNRRNQRVVF